MFRFVSWNQKQKILVCFGLFWCFEPISKQLMQREVFRNKPKQTETTLNFPKNTKICSLSNCWSSVCFGSIETSNLYVSVYTKTTEQTKTNWNNPKFSEKRPKYALYHTVSVALLFVSVKHWNSLFWYRTETTETKVLFRIVPKLVSVTVLVVLNWN